MNNLLYIGLNGYAGAGKDTVAKMLRTILSFDWSTFEECLAYYKSVFTDPTKSATFESYPMENKSVLCIAYADQLKMICSSIFGIPVQRFYMNKSTAWICINKDFEYTEIRPEQNIITAKEYYFNYERYHEDANKKYWMSLREILVYVGTYVLQESVNRSIFVNIVKNKIDEERRKNPDLKYVIVTDNRFEHELDFINRNNGIMISIKRNAIKQLDNIAEHDLDDLNNYDYIIENNGTYDDLLKEIWDIVHDNIEFQNITVSLSTRDEISNYLRLIGEHNGRKVYRLCAPMKIQNIYHNDGKITLINPTGGPVIKLSTPVAAYGSDKQIIPVDISLSNVNNMFCIECEEY